MSEWISLIKHESAGDIVYSSTEHNVSTLLNIFRRKKKDIWHTVGLYEKRLSALLTVHTNVIEITRIMVYPEFRNQGEMISFVKRLYKAASQYNMSLHMGCVTSERLMSIMRNNQQSWAQCEDDPTSYKYLGI